MPNRRIQAKTFANGSVSVPSIGFTSSPATGWFHKAANSIGYAANGVEVMSHDAAGAFSWGPTAGLESSHTLRARNILVPAGAGALAVGLNFGHSGGGYGSIVYNAAHTSVTNQFNRQTSDTSTVLVFGQGVGGSAGEFFSIFGKASASAGNFTLTSADALARVDSAFQWVFGPDSTKTTASTIIHRFQSGTVADVRLICQAFSSSANSYYTCANGSVNQYDFGLVGIANAFTPSTASGDVVHKLVGGGRIIMYSNSGGVVLTNGATSWAVWSDRRLKKNIKPYLSGLSEIKAINSIRFDYISEDVDESKRIGFEAQNVREFIPEAVNGNEKNENLVLSMETLIPALVNSIKELASRIQALEARP